MSESPRSGLVDATGSRCPEHAFPDARCRATIVAQRGVWMPAASSPEFKRRAVALVRQGDKPIAQTAKKLGIAESVLRRWMA